MSDANDQTQNSQADSSSAITDANAQAQQEAEKWKNDYLYLKAEFENYKRHAIKERSDLMKYGSERLVVEILNVVDNFERALELKPSADNIQNYVKGVEMTATELKSALQKFGVYEVACMGTPFDPQIHEALSSEESLEKPEGSILRVFKKAYRFHDRVVRPAQVVVAKKPTGQ